MKNKFFKLTVLLITLVCALSFASCSLLGLDALGGTKTNTNKIEEIKGTDGLEFLPLDNGTYAVSVGSATMVSNITIPNYHNGKKVTEICEDAFRDCRNLRKISIPDTVKTIGSLAFYKCRNLTSVTIGSGIKSIKESAFDECESLVYVEFLGDIEEWCKIEFENGSANPISGGTELYIDGILLTELVIPDTVMSIGDYAFYNYDSLTSVTIPDAIWSIGDYAFYNCDSLTSVTIPDSVTSIGRSAFEYCDGLTLYCEAEKKPNDWGPYWNGSCPVYWYSEEAPTTEGDYWHYVDGVVTIWE